MIEHAMKGNVTVRESMSKTPPVGIRSQPDSLISPPLRADGVGTALILFVVLLVSIAPLIRDSAQVAAAVGIGFATAVAAYKRSREALHLGLFWTLVAATQLSGVRYSQFTLGFSIAAYAAIVWLVPWLRGTVGWARRGTLGWDVRFLIVAAVTTSSAALVVWYQLTEPDLSDIIRDFIPEVAPWLLITGALGFSMVNAMVEEVAYRGVMMHALDAAFGVGAVALVVQAVAFGILHMTGGFPRGCVGVALATIYGLMMGLVRRRSQGMLAPWLAHVLTDAAIAAIVLGLHAEP